MIQYEVLKKLPLPVQVGLKFTICSDPNSTYVLYILCYLSEMKNLSLKMDDAVFEETEKLLIKVKKNRNRYINDAVAFYNVLQKRRQLSKQLQKESKLVQAESMKVLEELEGIADAD